MSHKEFENNTSRTSTVVTAPQDQNNDSSSNSSTAITPNPHDFHTILVQTLQAVQETNERLRRVEGRLDSIEAAMRSIVEPSHTSNKRRCKENGPVPSEENFHDAPMQQQLEYIFEAVKLAHHEAQSLKEASVQPKNNMDAEERVSSCHKKKFHKKKTKKKELVSLFLEFLIFFFRKKLESG
jgi:hypothetical protein